MTDETKTLLGRFCARGAAMFCVLFAGFQAALAAGAPYGGFAWGGQSAVLPHNLRLASAGACIYLLAAAVVLLGRAGDVGRRWNQDVLRGLNALFALQLAVNAMGNLGARDPVERYAMCVACVVGFALCAVAFMWAPGTPRQAASAA